MLHREPHTGTTLHRIVDSGIDTGPVLGIERQKARYDESYLGNVLRLYSPGCDMIVKALRALDAGAEPGTYPQPAGGRYYSVPGAGDVARFEASGLQLVDGSERRTLAALLQRR
jgi:methionyl-tRNA formyltransferase